MTGTTNVSPRELIRSEVGVEQLALASWNAFASHDTSSRAVMFTGHLPSSLTISNPTPQICSTLVNHEYKKYTFNSKFKGDGELVKMVRMYTPTGDRNNINESPLKTFVYYDLESQELSCLENQTYFRLGTSSFGYSFNHNQEAEDEIHSTRRIIGGTVLGESPNIDEDGEYSIGIQCNVVMATLPGVVEDGMIISDEIAAKTKFKMYTTYVISCGAEFYPLNLYGDPDKDEYKIHPDIGEYVRDDGLLCALRRRDPVGDIANQNKYRLTEYDPFFDRPTFDYKGAKVVDVRVYSEFIAGDNGELITHRKMSIPEKMAEQPLKYIRGRKRYLAELYSVYKEEVAKNPRIRLSKEMGTLIFEAIQDQTNVVQLRRTSVMAQREKITKAYHKTPLDDYRIEITVEREITPTVGNKYTGFDGDKGIAVIVWPKAHMPTDALGNVADMVVDPTAVTKRTIAGRTLHHFIAGGMRDIRVRAGIKLGLPLGLPVEHYMSFVDNNPDKVKVLFDEIMGVRKELTPDAWRAVQEEGYARRVYEREMHRTRHERRRAFSMLGPKKQPKLYSVMEVEVLDFLVNGMNIEVQPDNEVPMYHLARIIKDKFTPQYGPVSYIVDGKKWTSYKPVMIGSLYQILLDKTGLENAAVASGRTQHFGFPAKLTHSERRSMPIRQQPTRSQGESEVHNEIAAAGSKFTYELLEASNSPKAHRRICQAIFDAVEPTRLVKVIGSTDPDEPISRPLEIARHILECGGSTLVQDEGITNY